MHRRVVMQLVWIIGSGCPAHALCMGAGLPGALQTRCNVPSAHSPWQERFRRSLPGVEAWQARVVQECKRQGYVEVGGCACLLVALFVVQAEQPASA